jgi:hypothetical protein
MIYDSLRKLPKVTQVEILETGNVLLLDTEITNPERVEQEHIQFLFELWSKLCDEFNERYNTKNHRKTFDVYKELNFLANKYDTINNAVEALKFDKDERLINMINDYGYKISDENYLKDLEKIARESEGIIHKINMLKSKLPKQNDEDDVTQKETDVLITNMAIQTSILGYDFDFYNISVEKYHAMLPIIENKIKAIEKQNSKTKTKK